MKNKLQREWGFGMHLVSKRLILFAFLGVAVASHCYAAEPWTNTYQKFFNEAEMVSHAYTLSSLHEKWDVIPFKQLIFCWNAHRPKSGYFEFFGRVRDRQNKKWLTWHKMASWGSGIQRSYSDHKPQSHYEFVRLEMQNGCLADAFEIRAEVHEGASLSDLKMISVTVARLDGLRPEAAGRFSGRLDNVLIKGLPRKSQWRIQHPDEDKLCSPTALSMVVGYLMNKPIDSKKFADDCYDQGLRFYGSWPFNIAHAFDICKGGRYFFVTRLDSFEDIHNKLKKGLPVIVSVRGDLKGAPKSFPNGHLLTVIGFDNKQNKVICHDSAFRRTHQVFHAYDLDDFLAAWEKSHRLAYVCQNQQKQG